MNTKKAKKTTTTKVMQVASIVVALIAILNLVNSIFVARSIINQYISQGFKRADVLEAVLPTQFLPGVFSAVAYLGIAVLLWSAGLIYQKLSLISSEVVPAEEMLQPEPIPVETEVSPVEDELNLDNPEEDI
ncbi:MAG: hypothetical protein WAO24_06780 [Peptococcia bacterium]